MKKILVVIVLLFIVGGAGAYLYFYQPFSEVIQPAELLPEETLLYIEAANIKKSMDEFRAGPFGRAVSGIDWIELMRVLDTPPEETARMRQYQARLKEGFESPWFDTLFGDVAALAFFKPDLDKSEKPSEKTVFESFVMVVRPKQPAEMMQKLGKMFSKDVTITTETVGGVKMDKIIAEQDGPPLYVVIERGLGVMALDPAPILRCLDPGNPSSPKLINAPEYKALRTELASPEKTRLFSYINFHRLLDVFLEAAERYEPDDESVNDLKWMWAGFNKAEPVMGTVYNDVGEEIHSRWVVKFNKEALPPDIARLMDIPPQKNGTLGRVPEGVLYYAWQNTLKKTLAASFESPPRTPEEKAEIMKMFEGMGIPYDEVVSALGEQMAIVVRDVLTGGMFPVPELAVMIQVKKPEIIDRLVDSAAQGFGLPLEEKGENGVRIRHVILPYGEDISPGYGCVDGFCIISSNLQLLKTLLNKPGSGQTLADSELYKRVDKGLSEPNNQVAYIHTGKWCAKAKQIVKWGLSFLMMSAKPEKISQLKYFSEKVVTPLLDGLAMYQAVGMRTFIGDNRAQSDVYVAKEVKE